MYEATEATVKVKSKKHKSMCSSKFFRREVKNIFIIKILMLMQKNLLSSDNVSLCYKNSCIHAKGSNANLIATGAFIMLLLFGLSALSKTN